MIQKERNFSSEVINSDSEENSPTVKTPLTKFHSYYSQNNEDNLRHRIDKIFVGTGFTFDITDYFNFSRKVDGENYKQVLKKVAGSPICWLVLLYSLINSAILPVWILTLNTNKFVALTWRYFLEAFVMIPFVLYEKRTWNTEIEKYPYPLSMSSLSSKAALRGIYICSSCSTLWYALVLTAIDFTFIGNALYLGSLANYFLSLIRHNSVGVSKGELVGEIVVMMGIGLILFSSQGQENWGVKVIWEIVPFFLSEIVLITSYTISKVKYYFSITITKPDLPPYLSLCLMNLMSSVNMMLVAYFLNGASFDSEPVWGFFSLFSDYQAALFFYTLTILTVGMVVTYSLISKMFVSETFPSIVLFLEPIVTIFMLKILGHIGHVEIWALLGFLLLNIGMAVILIAHQLYTGYTKETLIQEKEMNEVKLNFDKPIESEENQNLE